MQSLLWLVSKSETTHTQGWRVYIHCRIYIFYRFYICYMHYIHFRFYTAINCIFATASIFTVILYSLQALYLFYVLYSLFRWLRFSKGLARSLCSLGGSKMAVGIYHSIKEGIQQLVKKSFDLHWWPVMDLVELVIGLGSGDRKLF